MSHSPLTKQLKAARRVSVPLVAVATPDPAATVQEACTAINGEAAKLQWDFCRGVQPLNDFGRNWIAATFSAGDPTVNNPLAVLTECAKLPAHATLFVHNAHRFLESPAIVQALWNLRDQYKLDHRTCILLGPSFRLPPEIAGDVLLLDEPLPDAAQLRGCVEECLAAADLPRDEDAILRAVEALQGLPAFAAEQATAMSLTKEGIALGDLWERKRKAIENTPGLKVYREGEVFSDIGGCENVKTFLARLVHGPNRPNAVVFLDEIEKAMGGKGDTSGVSQDQLGAILTYMQDHAADGMIFIGPPGAAKSACAKATGNEAGVPTVQLDLGAAKGSLVGQSEQQLRTALKVITSVSNGRSLWIATCNSIGDLPPELRRRFTLGTYFFDLPTEQERNIIWALYITKYDLPMGEAVNHPHDEGWTGAEIKTCCRLAAMLNCTLREAAQYIVPVARSAADQIDRLRQQADGRFLSASYPGVYRRDGHAEIVSPKAARRKVSLSE